MLFPSPAIGNTVRENKIEQIHNLMELSRDKDVYTFSRYRKEFLNTKKQFTPPWATLTPRATTRAMDSYTSPVVTSFHETSQDDTESSSTRHIVLDSQSCHIDELITQIESRGLDA
jgi:hypothetical protein